MRLKLRVTPKSRADEILGLRDGGVLHVRVAAAPQEGQANEAVLKLLSRALRIPKGSIRIKGGAASRDKWIELDGIDAAELKRRLGRESA